VKQRPAYLAAVFGLFLAQALAFTFPLVRVFSTATWGARFDLWNNLWVFWFVRKAVLAGDFDFLHPVTDLVFHPWGEDFLVDFGHYGLQVFAIPFQSFLTLVQTYNLMMLLVMTVSALGAYLLVEYVTGSRLGGLVAGTLFMVNPFVLDEMTVGSLEMVAMQWVPLFILFMEKTRREGGWLNPVLAGIFLALTGPFNWMFGLLMAYFGIFYTAWHAWSWQRRSFDCKFLKKAALAGVVFLVLILPLAWPFAQRSAEGKLLLLKPEIFTPALLERYQSCINGDLPLDQITDQDMGYFLAFHTLLNSTPLTNYLMNGYSYKPHESAPSLIFLALVGLGLVLSGQPARFWKVALAGFWILSFGPYLCMFSGLGPWVNTNYPLPYLLLYNYLPFFSYANRPYRFMNFVVLIGVVVAGFALARIRSRLGSGWWKTPAIFMLVMALAFLEWWFFLFPAAPRPMAEVSIPSFYRTLAADSRPIAILELPGYPLPTSNQAAQFKYYQTLHGKFIFNKLWNKNPPLLALRDVVVANSLLRALILTLPTATAPVRAPVSRKDLDFLLDADYRYVLLHTEFDHEPFNLSGPVQTHQMASEPLIGYLTALCGEPRQPGDGILAFDITSAGRKARWEGAGEAADPIPRPYHRVSFLDMEADGLLRIHLGSPGGPGVKGWYLPITAPPADYDSLTFWVMGQRMTPGKLSIRLRLIENDPQGIFRYHTTITLEQGRWKRIHLRAGDLVGEKDNPAPRGTINFSRLSRLELETPPQAEETSLMLGGIQLGGGYRWRR